MMALLVLGAIFIFFLLLTLAVTGLSGRGGGLALGARVGVVEIEGAIDSPTRIVEQLLRFRHDRSVKAIVLRIDSPGGAVGPSQEIYEEVRKIAAEKPIVVSMGSVAASGGYYVAAPAQRILANPGTITGSIGVIMEFANAQELLERIGLRTQTIKSGEHKDLGSPLRTMTERDLRILQNVLDDVHEQFVASVAEGRRMDIEQVRLLADGRIFTGRQALEAGLVDDLGNLQDAILLAAELGNIEGEPRVVFPPRERPGILDLLLESSVRNLQRVFQEKSPGLYYIWSGF